VLDGLFQHGGGGLRLPFLWVLGGGELWGHGEEDGFAVGALFLGLECPIADFVFDLVIQLALDGELSRDVCVEFEGDEGLCGGKGSKVELVGRAFFQGTDGVKGFTNVDSLSIHQYII
jgi:hypothetical protein